MSREDYIRRQKAWAAFHRWDSKQRKTVYENMPYEAKVAEFEELYCTALQRNPGIFSNDVVSEMSKDSDAYQHRLKMVEVRKRLRSYVA